ncbi:zinc double-stranded rna binding protein [Stemphylium lycopersici]|uniref:Zinc double-stranded rna binding protein n=1 Tax=Stemphylium lycopersici TaxID=183478 RepID=A0A364MV44_STELY|nr:zinc double-stranded rna binding protein [Stemphylium lycopersici]RAR04453.1 zinc double-stranded rna binding protein [Stemphylium lycopersici]
MSICVLCNRNFGSDKALKQHEVNSPKHASFGSDRTLKQDRVNSPEPALFGCKACNRSFSSQAALSQHQKDSAVHQRPRKDSGTTAVTPALLADNFPLPVPTSPNGRSTSQNDQSSRETTTENISRAYLTFDSPFTVLENRLRALNITDVNAIVAAQKIDQAHRPTRQQETKISFKFPELHQRIAEAVAPEIAFTWFNYDMEAHPEHSYTTKKADGAVRSSQLGYEDTLVVDTMLLCTTSIAIRASGWGASS